MKELLSSAVLLLGVVVVGCKDDKEEVIDKRVLKSISLTTDRPEILANNDEKASFSFVFIDQRNSSMQVDATNLQIFVNGTLHHEKYVTASDTEPLLVSAKLGDVVSNTITVTGQSFSLSIAANYNYFYANGHASVDYEIHALSATNEPIAITRVNPKLWVNNTLQSSLFFSTESVGDHVAHVTSGIVESNSLTFVSVPPIVHEESIEIPVVFHLVHDKNLSVGDLVNPPYDHIKTAFNRMNAIFAADGEVERIDFRSAVASQSKIKFVLADKDPDGNNLVEKGVVRYPMDKGFFSQDEADDIALDHIWDTESYINIFLISVDNSWWTGFATYPYTSIVDPLSGLVSGASTLKPAYDLIMAKPNALYLNEYTKFRSGQFLAHEIGHFLGLIHVFSESGCPAQDPDYCPDTYKYDRAAYLGQDFPKVLTRRITCEGSQVPASNVMDYYFHNQASTALADIESSIFTQNQVSRMYHVLKNSPVRRNLGTRNSEGGRKRIAPYTSTARGTIAID